VRVSKVFRVLPLNGFTVSYSAPLMEAVSTCLFIALTFLARASGSTTASLPAWIVVRSVIEIDVNAYPLVGDSLGNYPAPV